MIYDSGRRITIFKIENKDEIKKKKEYDFVDGATLSNGTCNKSVEQCCACIELHSSIRPPYGLCIDECRVDEGSTMTQNAHASLI